jgi:sec-independent protein translocase protein TatC
MANLNLRLPSTNDKNAEAQMGIMEHLVELRNRVMIVFIAVAIGVVVSLFFTGDIMKFLQMPYGRPFNVLGPTGGVVAYFRVALTCGAILAIPIITYQALMFVLPALEPKEKRMVWLSLPPITFLFVCGVAFAWFILIPPALGFLEGFQPTLFRPDWTADLYLSFVTALIFWMGVAFETPLIFFVLGLLGVVEAPALIKNWRIAIVGSAIAAALITPTVDPVNMAIVIVPLLVLYCLSIVLVMIAKRLRGA